MAPNKNKVGTENKQMVFDTWNYKVLIIGLFLIIIGFTAMYLENEVMGFISLFISPILIMAGYLTVILAIMKHKGTSDSATPGHSPG